MNSDQDIVESTRRLIQLARSRVPWYAGDFAPVRTDQLHELMRRSRCEVHIFPFRSDTPAMVMPAAGGIHPIFVDRDSRRADVQFAQRHELAHVLAGDVEGAVFLSDADYMAPAERTADLFALTDLVPGWLIRHMRRGRLSWRRILEEVQGAIRINYAEGWPEERLQDRAGLRLDLFRQCP